jgi:hypothetical protein
MIIELNFLAEFRSIRSAVYRRNERIAPREGVVCIAAPADGSALSQTGTVVGDISDRSLGDAGLKGTIRELRKASTTIRTSRVSSKPSIGAAIVSSPTTVTTPSPASPVAPPATREAQRQYRLSGHFKATTWFAGLGSH